MKLSERLEIGTPVFSDLKPHEAAAVSQAISMKRIADALDRMTKVGGGSIPFRMGEDFAAGIEQVAFSIGQQLDRGSKAG